jgi:putative phage-type endonuclease
MMELLSLAQGSPEWLAHRARHFNASDAPAMLGASPYKSRRQLLAELSTGITPEVDAATQRRFNNGHRLEALARPVAERIMGEPLYPVTGTNGRYSASFDGLTLGGEAAFEHKALNAELRQALAGEGPLPLHYRVQVEHQFLVSGADRILFMASDFDADGTLLEEHHRWIEPDPVLRQQLVDGWERFAHDLATFEPGPEAPPPPVASAPETLPALRIEVEGTVIASNLVAFRETALSAIRGVNRMLSTDQDFADAELSVKWCREVEKRIEGAKAHALSQTASIEELFRTLDGITAESRRVRLDLEKLIATRKESLKADIVRDAARALGKHIAAINAEIEPFRIGAVDPDFAGAVKGKRSIAAMNDAVDMMLADARIRADALGRIVRTNSALYRERAAGLEFLFSDVTSHIGKPAAEFAEWVANRITLHRLSEDRRMAEATAKAAEEADRCTKARGEWSEVGDSGPVVPNELDDEPGDTPAVEEATLSLGEVNARLGLTVSAAFVASIGITPAGKARRALLFTENQFAAICRGIVSHVQAVRMRHGKVRASREMEVSNGSH